ncbi:MAG: methyltransferase family protein [Planctomycetota bacterium]
MAKRAGEAALKLLGAFVILEPVWMLLPFAGFLYGSVLRIQTLNRNPGTAWLTHFVFPVLTLRWLGPALVVAGLAIFMVGAGQIYWSKIRRSGLVTKGLYRFVRHPQYISLTLFGVGILLAWGRAITFIAFFVMMFVYYYLAKSEERRCLALFGEEYERYRERTSFILPGDRLLRPLGSKLPGRNLPAPARVAGAFAVTMAVCFGLMWIIGTVKETARTVPYLTATVSFRDVVDMVDVADARGAGEDREARWPAVTTGASGGVPFAQAGRVAVVRGPYRNGAAPGFAERVLLRLPRSSTLEGFLAFLDKPAGDVAIVFCAPFVKPEQPGTPGMHAGSGRRGPPPDPSGPDRVRLIILRCVLSPGASIADAFEDRSKRTIKGARIAPVNLARPEGADIVEGTVVKPGPRFPGEERWDFFMEQLAARGDLERRTGREAAGEAVIPGRFPSATLVMVKAPILRTRLDPAFAKEILDRLVHSARFRDHLRKSGAGGGVVPVAFPRPGPNWYREHHGKPEISAFVIMTRLAQKGAAHDALFRPDGRELLGAFTAEIDFGIEPPSDSVGEIATVGPRRDLEERWRFFLSGL